MKTKTEDDPRDRILPSNARLSLTPRFSGVFMGPDTPGEPFPTVSQKRGSGTRALVFRCRSAEHEVELPCHDRAACH